MKERYRLHLRRKQGWEVRVGGGGGGIDGPKQEKMKGTEGGSFRNLFIMPKTESSSPSRKRDGEHEKSRASTGVGCYLITSGLHCIAVARKDENERS